MLKIQPDIKPCVPGCGKRTVISILPALRFLALLAVLLAAAPGRAASLDGERMLNQVCEQCNFGPRIPGTPPHDACKKWIVDQIKALGMTVQEQPYTASLALTGKTAPAVNLWGLPSADGPTSPALILCAHWDTRPLADKDPSGANPPMLGANDGAAAVAIVLELARALRATPLGPHVAIAFWDAEDSGTYSNDDSWGVGARYAAEHPQAWVPRVRLGILFDMVAGQDLTLYPETNSQKSARAAVDKLWRVGTSLAPKIFSNDDLRTVVDDHLPWVQRGVPFIDLCGIDFKYWHTAGDNPAHCSAPVMQSVATVVYNYLVQGSWK